MKIPEKLLNQQGGMPGILTFDHKYVLEPKEESGKRGTLLTIHEEYRGIYVPFWNPTPVEMAYKQLAHALKERAIQELVIPGEEPK